jgi:putative flippase GtrA
VTGLHALLRRLLLDRRVRFLIVGGINVVQGVGWFSLLHLLLGQHVNYMVTLVLSYVPAILIGFWLYRTLVFDAEGHLLLDLARFTLVQGAALGINAVSLPFFHEIVRLPLVVSQACSIVVIIVFNYVGHLYFSFRRRHGHPQAGHLIEPRDEPSPTR